MHAAARRLLVPAPLTGLVLAAGAASVVSAQAPDPSFRLSNQGTAAIEALYVASAAASSWGDDRLGSRTLGSGQSVTIRLPAGQCVNDIRVVPARGEARERRRVNTCSIGDLVFPQDFR